MNEEMQRLIDKHSELILAYAQITAQVGVLLRLAKEKSYIDPETIRIIFGGEENDVRGTSKSE